MKLELLLPVKPFHLNQGFGQNLNSFYAQQGMKGHGGLDMYAKHGEPIYAAIGGVCYPQIDSHGGNGVVIITKDKYEFNGDETYAKVIYWHLIQDDAVVHTGQEVKTGDLIGYADNTGTSTGDHLHFGLYPCDINGNNLFPTNGYGGAIDPSPYGSDKYAQDINNAKYIFTKTLKKGNWNADVKELQQKLKDMSLYSGVIDGVFGPKTELAVKAFQTAHGLISDGIVGPKTNAELNK